MKPYLDPPALTFPPLLPPPPEYIPHEHNLTPPLFKDVKPEGLCDPLLKTTVDGVELDLNPCGLIANSMFNGECV